MQRQLDAIPMTLVLVVNDHDQLDRTHFVAGVPRIRLINSSVGISLRKGSAANSFSAPLLLRR